MKAAVAVKVDQLPQVDDPMVSMIERMARDPSVDVDKLERMMAMHERVSARNAEQAFNEAMNEAQSKIGRIAADKENSQTHSWYATYAALDRVVRPVYVDCGFSLSFDTGEAPDGMVCVLCYVSHRSGHTRTYRALIPADGKGAKGNDVMTKTHAVGSGMQYGQRYLLKMIFNIAIGIDPTDDDGNGAGGLQFITDEQVIKLREWIESTNSDEAKFLKFLKVESLAKIPAKSYETALAALRAKERK